MERPDGRRLTVLAHANPIHDESGKLTGALNVLVDISDPPSTGGQPGTALPERPGGPPAVDTVSLSFADLAPEDFAPWVEDGDPAEVAAQWRDEKSDIRVTALSLVWVPAG